jgi:ADP-dependent NAD(P)H-hydrate dehydratase / NAD(P)H-hydrate epimerase
MTTRRAPASLWSAASAAEADRHTMETLGVPSPTLMERAALTVSHEIAAVLAGERLPVVVLVGPGNNGGDGLAVARQLRGWGIAARARLVTPRRNAAAEQQLTLARAAGVPVDEGVPPGPARGRHVVVDALLGTGSRGEPRGPIAEALRWQRGLHGPRVAVDAPTGVDIDTGEAAEAAFSADLTVTFVRSKPGLHVMPGRHHAGRVVVADIGIVAPPTDATRWRLIDGQEVAGTLRALPAGRHKGERGHLAIVGGSETTAGATVLAGAAGLRAGAGLVTIVTRSPVVREQLLAHRPELMVASWEPEQAPVEAATALVVGPGLTDPGVHDRLRALWTDDPRPAAWDASALDHVPLHVTPAGPRIVTPHPGEAARLLARAEADARRTPDPKRRRWAAALALGESLRAIVVLKGEGTIVVEPDRRVAVAVTGGPALATAGTGDVLAGLIGALLVRGLDPWDAATAGVHLHGLAGDLAAARRPGCVAMDVADAIGRSMTDSMLRLPVIGWPAHRLG